MLVESLNAVSWGDEMRRILLTHIVVDGGLASR